MPAAPPAISCAARSNGGFRRSASRTTFLSTSCPKESAIPGSRCGRTSSTATSARSRSSVRSSGAPSRSDSVSRPTTPKDTRRRSRAGWPAPTGTWSWARCTGWTAAGSTIRRPLPPASRARAWSRSTTEYYALLAKAARTGFFDVLTHFDLPKKHGHRPAAPREAAEAEAIRAAKEAGVRRRDLLRRTAQARRRGLSGTAPAAPDRRRGHSRDVLLRRPCAGGGRLGLRADAGAGPRSGRLGARHVREAAKGSPAAPSPVNHRPIAAKTSADGRRRRAKVE